MTPYSAIYKRFLDGKIEDIDLAGMDAEDREEMLHGYLMSALAYIEADALKMVHDLSDIDDEELCFNDDLTNAEVEVISMYMVAAWYDVKVNSLDHTMLFLGTKEEKWTNQRDHWKATVEIRDHWRRMARKYFRNHSSRINTYIGNTVD